MTSFLLVFLRIDHHRAGVRARCERVGRDRLRIAELRHAENIRRLRRVPDVAGARAGPDAGDPALRPARHLTCNVNREVSERRVAVGEGLRGPRTRRVHVHRDLGRSPRGVVRVAGRWRLLRDVIVTPERQVVDTNRTSGRTSAARHEVTRAGLYWGARVLIVIWPGVVRAGVRADLEVRPV